MSDYPDPDEEFELMYGDDLDALRDIEDEPQKTVANVRSKRSLDFSSPVVNKTFGNLSSVPGTSTQVSGKNLNDDGATLDESGIYKLSQTDSINTEGISIIEPVNNKDSDNISSGTSQKRNLDDLFGEIDDLNFDDIEEFNPKSKRRKDDKDTEDEELIERILMLRKLKQQSTLPSSTVFNRDAIHLSSSECRLSFVVPKWPFLALTRSDGQRIYVGYEDDSSVEQNQESNKHEFKNLLGVASQNIWNEAKKYLETKLNQNVPQNPTESMDIDSMDIHEKSDQLWVERYKPRNYLELLSDESTNRTLLYWIKMWDKVVFNREVKVKQPEVKSKFNKRSGKFEFGMKNKKDGDAEWETPLDEHGRPRKLLALLCGPPGTGKTTLAHLLARHAGYKVIEINASDDRNVDAFKTALENATQMKSVLDKEKRPNCLILDEIDGAPAPAIDYLLKFAAGTLSGKQKKGQKAKPQILRRPIICICNDPYAPALRPLRQVAMVLHLAPPGASRLSERLMEVSLKEGLVPDPPLLSALGERTNRDIRSCLTILHFCKLKGKQLKLADIQLDKLNIGMKDSNRSLFQVWQDVFQVQGDESTRSKRLLHSVMSTGEGDYERLVNGVYENFLEMKMRDSRLQSVCMALDWFEMYDTLSSFIMSTQNYSLMGYMPYSFLCWHHLFASMSWPNIKYPNQNFQMYQRQMQMSGIVSCVQKGVCPQVKPYCSKLSLLLDIVPLLPHIISPFLRPVNIQLYTEREKKTLSSLMGVMLDYNLQYTQQRLPDGNYHYLLDPDIAMVGVFDEKTANVRNLTYSMKQLIAREVELERIRQTEVSSGTATSKAKPKEKPAECEAKTEDNKPLPNHLQRLEPKKMKMDVPLVMKDFFGRTITCSPATAIKKIGRIGDIVKSPTWYHYKEGFNNAVRRDVKISDLL